jgi:hypothetical protein
MYVPLSPYYLISLCYCLLLKNTHLVALVIAVHFDRSSTYLLYVPNTLSSCVCMYSPILPNILRFCIHVYTLVDIPESTH